MAAPGNITKPRVTFDLCPDFAADGIPLGFGP